MQWIVRFFRSSIGRKILMSLTGLFFITFLIIHLLGNLQLLKDDGGEAFNTYAYFMTHNPVILFISYGLYFFIIVHTIVGLLLAYSNRKAKSSNYAVTTYANATWTSKNMALLGTFVLFFICIHMGDFWWKMKTGALPMITYEGLNYEMKDLYTAVYTSFQQLWIVIVYVIGLLALAFHLEHGFSAAFQTLGIRHKKYTPLIKGIGRIYTVLITLGYLVLPIYIYIIQ